MFWENFLGAKKGQSTATVARAPQFAKTHARWLGPGEKTTVAGRAIDGMVYLGEESPREEWALGDGTSIDPDLPVAGGGADIAGETMPYWPSYHDISPPARAAYLDWLASGRSDTRYSVGYVFLFFYGLERRFFMDSPAEEEKRLIITEVKRLLGVYGENHSVRGYLGAFLDAAQSVLDPSGASEPCFERIGYDLPIGLRLAIGRMLQEGCRLDADWLLAWYVTHPETSLRMPMVRAFPECRALFNLLFEGKFPEGLKVSIPKRHLRAQYHAASSAFKINLARFFGNVPDVSGLSKPIEEAQCIVDEVTDALGKYSRFLGRCPEGRNTIEAHVLLPESLRPLFPCDELEDIRRWAEGIIDAEGFVPVENVIERLEDALPAKITKRQLIGAADALARLSIGMAPDPRFALRRPKYGEPVVLFRLPEGITKLEEVSDGYHELLTTITIGLFIAHADKMVVLRESQLLETRINSTDLSHAERVRLLANIKWMTAVPPNATMLRQRLKDTTEDARHELGQLALAVAIADGIVVPEEVQAIQKLYKSLGLPADNIYSDLHCLAVGSEPVTVRPAGKPEAGFAVPPLPGSDGGKLVLDADRIARIRAGSAHASVLLEAIFSDSEPEEAPEEADEEDVGTDFSGLDRQHAAFLEELLTRSQWKADEFTALAERFSLLPDGAFETLNEWSIERFDDMLIEEHEGYDINQPVAAACRQ